MAGPFQAWKCKALSKKSRKHGTVLVEWQTGFLKGKPARILAVDMKACDEEEIPNRDD